MQEGWILLPGTASPAEPAASSRPNHEPHARLVLCLRELPLLWLVLELPPADPGAVLQNEDVTRDLCMRTCASTFVTIHSTPIRIGHESAPLAPILPWTSLLSRGHDFDPRWINSPEHHTHLIFSPRVHTS